MPIPVWICKILRRISASWRLELAETFTVITSEPIFKIVKNLDIFTLDFTIPRIFDDFQRSVQVV